MQTCVNLSYSWDKHSPSNLITNERKTVNNLIWYATALAYFSRPLVNAAMYHGKFSTLFFCCMRQTMKPCSGYPYYAVTQRINKQRGMKRVLTQSKLPDKTPSICNLTHQSTTRWCDDTPCHNMGHKSGRCLLVFGTLLTLKTNAPISMFRADSTQSYYYSFSPNIHSRSSRN